MAGFNSAVEVGARLPFLLPFHGFAYETTYQIPCKEKEVQVHPPVADHIRAHTAEMMKSLRARGHISSAYPGLLRSTAAFPTRGAVPAAALRPAAKFRQLSAV
jgi:hypothetical protein